MRVLVTGASGMLGRACAERLRDRGDQVRVLQRGDAAIDGVEQVRGDVTDPAIVTASCREQDAVLHLAAKVDVVGPWHDYERVNVGGTRAVVAACRAADVPRLVQVSSPSVAHHGGPLVGAGAGPADPARARGAYARSKAAAEQLALAADSTTLAVLAVRPHLVWGPGDTQLVQRIWDRARAGRLPLLAGGLPLIDTTYVDNAAAALVAAVDAPAHGEALVVSNGEPRPVGEILSRLCLSGGVPPPARSVPRGLGRVAAAAAESWTALTRGDNPLLTGFLVDQLTTAHWFDQRRTRQTLGWTPDVTLEDGFGRLTRARESAPGSRTGPRDR